MAIGSYRITVVYHWTGSTDMDEPIRRLAGKRDWASGCGFGDRDLDFEYKSRKRRDNAAERLRSSGLPITVDTYDGTDEN